MNFQTLVIAALFSSFMIGCAQGPSSLSWGSAELAITPLPSSGGGGGSTATLINADETAALLIFQQYCTSCHTATSGPYNVYGFTDINHLTSSGLVVEGSPSGSPIYQVISSGEMPPGAPLSATDVTTISNWISGN